MPSQVHSQPEESFLPFPAAVTVSGTAIIPRSILRLFDIPSFAMLQPIILHC